MERNAHPLSGALLIVLAAFFSALLISTTVIPTVMSVSYGKVVVVPAPVEEEQMHGRDISKSALHHHSAWNCVAISLRERMRASLRDRDEALPADPISEVPLQPPKGV